MTPKKNTNLSLQGHFDLLSPFLLSLRILQNDSFKVETTVWFPNNWVIIPNKHIITTLIKKSDQISIYTVVGSHSRILVENIFKYLSTIIDHNEEIEDKERKLNDIIKKEQEKMLKKIADLKSKLFLDTNSNSDSSDVYDDEITNDNQDRYLKTDPRLDINMINNFHNENIIEEKPIKKQEHIISSDHQHISKPSIYTGKSDLQQVYVPPVDTSRLTEEQIRFAAIAGIQREVDDDFEYIPEPIEIHTYNDGANEGVNDGVRPHYQQQPVQPRFQPKPQARPEFDEFGVPIYYGDDTYHQLPSNNDEGTEVDENSLFFKPKELKIDIGRILGVK